MTTNKGNSSKINFITPSGYATDQNYRTKMVMLAGDA